MLKFVVAKAGYSVELLGGERLLGNLPAAAAYLEVSPEVLLRVRQRCAIPGPLLRAELPLAA